MAVLPVGATGVSKITAFTPQKLTTTGTTPTDGNSFAKGLKAVSDLQTNADQLATQVATGQLDNIADFTTAAAKASLAVSLTAALRNRAVEAYQDIMRMQV